MYYPKLKVVEPYLEESGEISINEDRLFPVALRDGIIYINGSQVLQNRTVGMFMNKSIYLPSFAWDWALGKDDYGEVCLVPIKK